MTRSPKQAASEWADCLRQGDFQRLVALHDPDLVCALLGTSLVSGRFRGRDAFFAHTMKHVLGAMAETDEIYLKGFRIVCADSQRSVMLLHGGFPTRSGGRYDQNYLQIFRVDDGLITETHELLDTVMLETQIFGRILDKKQTAAAEPLTPASRYSGVLTSVPAGEARDLEARFSDALQRGDIGSCISQLHPDAVMQIAGSTPVSGTVRGRIAISSALATYARDHFLPGSLRIDGSSWLACRDEGGFCRLTNLRGTLTNGRPYAQTLGIAAVLSGDSIVELYLYFDTAEEERQVFDNPLRGATLGTGPEPFSIFPSVHLRQ